MRKTMLCTGALFGKIGETGSIRVGGHRNWNRFLLLLLTFLLVPLSTLKADAATLSVLRTGSGQGSINSSPVGIACPGTCSAAFTSSVTLLPNPALNSLFRGWGGACMGLEHCTLTLASDQSVDALFDLKPSLVKVSGAYPGALQVAYNTVSPGGRILVVAGNQAGGIVLDKPITVTMQGGYDQAFTTAGTRTKVRGAVSVQKGCLKASRLAVASSVPASPPAPSGIVAEAGDGQISVSWDAVPGAGSYNVYYAKSAGVTRANGTKVAGATSGQVISGLTNGSTYFLVVTAVNTNGESVESSQVFTSPVHIPPSAPTGVTASAGNGKVEISWNSVAGASSYNIYWSLAPGVTKATGTKIASVAAPPYLHTSLSNGTTYYYIVTTNRGSEESVPSTVVSAKPAAAPAATRLIKMSVYVGELLKEYMLYEYDAQGNKSKESIYDFADNLKGYNTYEYDEARREIKRSNFVAGEQWSSYTTTEYNAAGNSVKIATYSVISGTAMLTAYIVKTYDDSQFLIKVASYNGFTNLWTQYTAYENNAQGKEIRSETYVYPAGLIGSTTTEYNEDGRKIKVSKFGPTGLINTYVTMEYNAAGKLVKESTYNGLTGLVTKYSITEYNAEGRAIKTSEFDFAGNLKGYVTTDYNAEGKQTKIATYDDTGLLSGYITFEYR